MLDSSNNNGLPTFREAKRKKGQTTFTFNGKSIQMLTPEEEYRLGMASKYDGCEKSRKRLVESHIKFARSIAASYKGYCKTSDDILQFESQAYIGLCKAAENFDPEKGFRFSTYARWWAKAGVQSYILENVNIIKHPTSGPYKKAFFHLNRIESKLRDDDPEITDFEVDARIAEELGLQICDVQDLRIFKRGSYSLNKSVNGEEAGVSEHIDFLVDNSAKQAETYEDDDELKLRRNLVEDAFKSVLTDREQYVFIERNLKDEPTMLKILAEKLGISSSRVQQIDARAIEKVIEYIHGKSNSEELLCKEFDAVAQTSAEIRQKKIKTPSVPEDINITEDVLNYAKGHDIIDEREMEILRARRLSQTPIPYAKIGKMLGGFTRQHIKQLEQKALRKLAGYEESERTPELILTP